MPQSHTEHDWSQKFAFQNFVLLYIPNSIGSAINCFANSHHNLTPQNQYVSKTRFLFFLGAFKIIADILCSAHLCFTSDKLHAFNRTWLVPQQIHSESEITLFKDFIAKSIC